MEAFTENVVKIIQGIPRGKVATYGQIAAMAGRPRAARQVARILHSLSRSQQLPWHRVVNAHGGISLPKNGGYEEQKARLEKERVGFDAGDRVDLFRRRWEGSGV